MGDLRAKVLVSVDHQRELVAVDVEDAALVPASADIELDGHVVGCRGRPFHHERVGRVVGTLLHSAAVGEEVIESPLADFAAATSSRKATTNASSS